MAQRVLVGGGTGFVGRYVCRTLENAGYKSLIISRNPKTENHLTWDEIESTGLPENLKAVINLAGEPVLNPFKRWDEAFQKTIHDSRIGTTNLLKKAIMNSKNPPNVFVTMSAVGFYPPDQVKLYDEYSSPTTSDYWSKFTTNWEAAGKFPSDFNEVRHVIVRCGVVLERDGGALQQMLPSFWTGFGGRYGCGTQWFPWIHADDIAGIFLHAVENSDVEGVLNGVAPEANTNSQFANTLGTAMWRPSLIPLPAFVLRAMFGSPRSSMLLEGQNVYPKRTLESGYQFKYPTLESALTKIIRSK
uniref:Epimerase family protein SDR39U1 n=1 Tax=Phallusia mammillata TaxID=59560 RepID=A0A6F9DSE4_9ASCI|nr:epimerase family protein SDR39U1 [Phallusia mammillata]